MVIQLSGTTLELQLLLALQCWGLNNWTAVSAAWTMTVQLHFRRFTLFQQQKITFRSPSQTYNYSKTDKRIPSFYFSRLVQLPELFGYFFKIKFLANFAERGSMCWSCNSLIDENPLKHYFLLRLNNKHGSMHLFTKSSAGLLTISSSCRGNMDSCGVRWVLMKNFHGIAGDL